MAAVGDLFAEADRASAGPQVHVAARDEAREWDAYVARRPEATLYHLFGWKTVAEEAYGLRTPFLVARDAPGGAIRGILPLIRVPRPFTQYLTTGLFGAYGALLADDDTHARALVAAATARIDTGEARHLHLKLLGDGPSGLGLERRDIWVTAKLDLGTDEDDLWRRLPKKQRWAVRQAGKADLEAWHGPDEFDGFYEVLFENMHRKGAPIYGKTFFRSVLRSLAPHASVVALRDRGRVVSGAFVASFRGTMYVPFASSRVDYFRHRINHLLYWEVMRYARSLGCRTLDFGSSLRDSSVLHFKRAWRPQLEPIRSYVYAAPDAWPKLDPRDSGVADVIVAAWSRLPRNAARILGPALCRWIA
jgi:serine/alanine adding enzyme